MTFEDVLAEVNDAFFTSDFADEVVYLPQGQDKHKFTTSAIVDWSDEEGNNQVRGDGRSINQDRGRSSRHSVKIDLPLLRTDPNDATKQIPLICNFNGKDRIIIKEYGANKTITVSVKRAVGRDSGMQTILCTFAREQAAQMRRTRFG